MKKILKVLIILLLISPIFIFASEKKNEYVDKVYDIVGIKEEKIVTVYFFHSRVCHHCINENKFLKELEKKYKNKIRIIKYQVYKDEKNSALMDKVKERFKANNGVPFTVIGDEYFLGYSTTTADQMDKKISEYLNNNVDSNITLPFLGKVNLETVSLPLVAIILGFLDGFNPCAMWVLLFLINMLFNMEDKKKMWILGLIFLFTSAFVYFLAMIGLTIVLGITATSIIQKIIALVAIIGGTLNIKTFIKTKNDGCHIVDEKKRKKYFNKIKKFTSQQNFILAIFGVITLAASVNLVELACSAGFPAIYVSILNLNNISGIMNVFYLLLYILFFLIDDIVVFVIAMTTLQITGITTKYNKFSHLIGGIIMILIGLLLIFKPEWIMLNF